MRRTRAHDAECTRFHGLAWAAYFNAGPRLREAMSDVRVGDAVVVLDGTTRGGHAANAIGTLVAHRPMCKLGRWRRELWTIRTPRGVVVKWTNCVLAQVDRL